MSTEFIDKRAWSRLANAAKKSRGPAAVAVAYFGQGAAKLLPLKNGWSGSGPAESKRSCRFAGWRDEDRWPEAHEALVEAMMSLERVLRPHLNGIKAAKG